MRTRLLTGPLIGCFVALLALALLMIDDAYSRGGRGGGGARGGGGFSRHGPASSGGFSRSSSRPSTGTRDAQSPRASTRDAQSPRAGTRDAPPSASTLPSVDNRPPGSTPGDGTRPPIGDRPPGTGTRPPPPVVVVPPPYYGGYYGPGWDYYDNDWMFGMTVGVVTGAAVASAADDDDDETTTTTTTTTTPATAALPCNPTVTTVSDVTYYQCGTQYFVQAYGGTGPIYMPVPPPG
jgi:hypothetical protein